MIEREATSSPCISGDLSQDIGVGTHASFIDALDYFQTIRGDQASSHIQIRSERKSLRTANASRHVGWVKPLIAIADDPR
jgi:hypothetical protein